ncbi:two-component system sensor histidine kinase YesM [Paenibacillus cellulosilyticus]|uniref:histidine kinase n=1 Tax=Paenibacillus cellulosilyticus TaxID=375489 RepID=A0A2V2YTY3_9BACL|nr:sensor histidine kinase [Paenibacillus cellulosilyticus]PWW02561.1 two-component system sensor histidine kinase YesM [Paenibacillus cellulosilyticus]QKS47252.1 histidine kinase [Paenibacillus cellulosilyticus]
MRNILNNISLIKKLLYLIVFILIVVLVSFTVSNAVAQRTVEKKVSGSANKIVLQVEETLNSFFTDMDGISYSLLYSPILQSYLSTEDALTKVLMNPEIIAEFTSTLALKENMMGIQLYDKEGVLTASVGKPFAPIAKRTVDEIEYALGTPGQTGDTYYTIAVPVYNLQNNRILKDYRGMCVFFMDVNNFTTILSKSKITEHSQLFLTDAENRIITGSEGMNAQTLSEAEKHVSDKNHIVLKVPIASNGWMIVSDILRPELFNDMDWIKQLNIISYAVIFLIFLLFLLLFYSQLLRPVRALIDFINTYARSGGQARFNSVHRNEIGVLGTSLNRMLDSIEQLSEEVQSAQRKTYEAELDRKQMEIAAYRNQINPHFLYNTLESIRALSLYHKVNDIAEITSSLSRLFRYSVKGDNFVTIREELAHLSEYASIIDFRFRGKIGIRLDADEELLEVRTVKLLLQPLVENAVFHGLEPKVEQGEVNVILRKKGDNSIRAIVADNGIGMQDSDIRRLMDSFRHEDEAGYRSGLSGHGIGLANSYRRLKLFYGEEANMEIVSSPGEGTTITLDFPANILMNDEAIMTC